MIQIFPTHDDLIWGIVNFLILFFVLRKFLYQPILGMMSSREKEIETNLAQAAEDRARAEQIRREFEEQLAGARREAARIIEEATRNANTTRESIVQEAQRQAEDTLQRAQDTIQREKDKALAEIRNQVVELSVLAAGKIIERELKQADHERLVSKFVDEVGKH